MIEQLTPPLRQPAQTVKGKWEGFLPKLQARIQDVVAEADAGLDDLMASHALDPGPMGAAFSALQARFHGLGKKLDEAWEKIDNEWDEVRDQDEVTAKDHQILSHVWATMMGQLQKTQQSMTLAYETIQITKSAAWARALWAQMEKDVRDPVPCSQCGAPLEVTVRHQASNVICRHCKASTTVHPGTAAGLLFQGNGMHALAQEQAYDLYVGHLAAEKKYNAFRVPISRDFDERLAAARAYYTRYYQAIQQMNPGFDGDVPKAVDAKLAHFTDYDLPVDRMTRAKFQIVVDCAATGNPQALRTLLKSGSGSELQRIIRIDERGIREIVTQGFKTDYDLDDCVWTVFEHGDQRGAAMLLEIQYEAEGEDDPKPTWIAEQLSRLSREVLSRG
jgi:ribosomal protein L37AE/L43A